MNGIVMQEECCEEPPVFAVDDNRIGVERAEPMQTFRIAQTSARQFNEEREDVENNKD